MLLQFTWILVSIKLINAIDDSSSNAATTSFHFTDVYENDNEALAEWRSVGLVARTKRYAIGAYAKVNWFIAQRLCSSQGMTLATINSKDEKRFLQNYLVDNNLVETTFWVSGTNAGDNTDWFWMSNGKPFKFKNWASEPNVPSNANDNDLNATSVALCLQILPNSKWSAENCFERKNFICENRCPLDSYMTPIFPDIYN